MKKANALVRKNDAEGLLNLGFSQNNVEKLLAGDYIGRRGFPGYELTNNNANIRRLKQRIQHLAKQAATETTEVQIEKVRIVDNPQENRTQIIFPDKPCEAVRRELKSRGFRWSPNASAWQRHLSSGARYWATEIVKKYYSKEN